jgi:hypothetical protein
MTTLDVSKVPASVRDPAIQSIYKYAAYVDTGGDAKVMDSIKEPPSLLGFIGLTLVLTMIAYVISEIANYYEIRQNWEKYRCQPTIAPFAKFYGHDVTETLNFCAAEAVKEHAPGIMAPIYESVNKVIGVVDGVYEKAEAVEGGIADLIGGFSNFVTNFVNSLGLIGTRIRMSVVRIKDIFMRLYGSFIAFVYAGISAITFGNNLICNPLVTFVAGFAGVDLCCFAPGTQIAVATGGSSCAIENIRIGTQLVGGARVTSVYRFDGRATHMVRIHGIHVSGNHYVPAPGNTGKMIHAAAHSAAIKAESIPVIYCLATTTNTIPVIAADSTGQVHMFADYEESYDPTVIAETQRAVEKALNGRERAGPTVTDYSLGIDSRFCVKTHTGETRVLCDIQLGDILESGARVSGIVSEVCEYVCAVPDTSGLVVSAAQLVFWGGLWQRASNVWSTIAAPPNTILCHVLLDGNKSFVIYTDSGPLPVRDYAEHEDDAIVQVAYDRMMGVKGD